MKNILVTLVFVLFACCPHAEASGFDKPVDDYDPDTQTSDNIFTFKGIPIKGTVSEFSKKLQQQGYKYDSEYLLPLSNEERVVLSGKFIGQDVYIYLIGDTSSHEIYLVRVKFYDTRDYSGYRNIRNLLSQKYNDPYKWAINDTYDIKEYPDIETREAIRQGYYKCSYAIYNINTGQPYIILSWAEYIILDYYNPHTTDNDQQSMSDL